MVCRLQIASWENANSDSSSFCSLDDLIVQDVKSGADDCPFNHVFVTVP